MGADAAKESLQKGKARLVLLAGDLSPRSERNARRRFPPVCQWTKSPARWGNGPESLP